MLSLLELFSGILITEWTFIFAARYLLGKYINEWYTKFGGWAVLSDISSISIGLFIAMYLYRGKNFIILCIVAVLVQWIHDILFYLIILRNVHTKNSIIELLRPYGNDAGILALIGDSWMMLGSLLFALLVSKLSIKGQIFTVLVSGYMLPYAIFEN
jgi:hypothetical protein